MTKKYGRFATVHMIYWFVDLCSSSIHRSVGRYFISTRYPSNDTYGGPSFSITNHNIYLYYWLLWIADIFKWQHEMIYWVNTYTSQLNELGILARQQDIRHDTSCVHNQQLCVDRLLEVKGLGIIVIRSLWEVESVDDIVW